jgi:hypothetical protein
MDCLYASWQEVEGLMYTCDKEFFKTPNALNSYWAGFIAADGCLSERDHALIIVSKDKDHLVKFVTDIKFSGSIKDSKAGGYKPGIYFRLSIYGLFNMFGHLKSNFNITPQKTKTLSPPVNLSLDCQLAFIAGFIDGDGSIFRNKKGIHIALGGTRLMMEWIASIVNNLAPVKKLRLPRNTYDWFYEYKIVSKRAEKLIDLILPLDLPLMDRKWRHVKN